MSSSSRTRCACPSQPYTFKYKPTASLPRLLPALALITLLLLTLPGGPARAQSSSGDWTVTDGNGNTPSTNSDGSYNLTGTMNASATDTYPQDLPSSLYSCFGPNPNYGGTFFNGPKTGSFGDLWCQAFNSVNGTGSYYNGSIFENLNGNIHQGGSGQIAAFWNWTGSGDPPDHLNLLLTTSLSASASAYYGSSVLTAGMSATASASDGLNERASAKAGDAAGGASYPYWTNASAGGRHLVRAQVVNGQAEVYLNGALDVLSDDEVPYSTGGYPGSGGYPGGSGTFNGPTTSSASASVSASAQLDDREVTLTRNGARQVTKMALPNGEVVGEWVDPDGTGHGDSTFSYTVRVHAGNYQGWVPNYNWQYFQPNFSNGWSPTWYAASFNPNYATYLGDPNDPLYLQAQTELQNNMADINTAEARTQNAPAVLWSWSPGESNDWELFGKWSAPFGTPPPNGTTNFNSNDRPHPAVTLPITYTATASLPQGYSAPPGSTEDGATATATYEMTFHDAVDGWHSNGPPSDGPTTIFPSPSSTPPTPPTNGAQVNLTIPLQLDQLDDVTDNQMFSGAAGTTGIILPLLQETPTVPTRIAAAMLALASFSVGNFGNPVPNNPNTVPVPTDPNAFKQDIKFQEWINSGLAVASPMSNPYYVPGCDQVLRFSDSSWADTLAQMTQTQQEAYWGGQGQDSNGAFGHFQARAYAVIHSTVEPWAGYQFDPQGLVVGSDGKTPVLALATITRAQTSVDTARTWMWVYSKPPGN